MKQDLIIQFIFIIIAGTFVLSIPSKAKLDEIQAEVDEIREREESECKDGGTLLYYVNGSPINPFKNDIVPYCLRWGDEIKS